MTTLTVSQDWRMATSDIVEAQVNARYGHTEIDDSVALAIAASWQSPSGHGATFAQLASTRTVDVEELLDAIHYERPHAVPQGEQAVRELDMLATWAMHHPSRKPLTKSEIAAHLTVCELHHGAPGNAATVYGHHGSKRTCIRLHGTDTWVYDPGWEK